MPCYHPLLAWRYPDPSSKSGYSLDFRQKANFYHPQGEAIQVPCGRCIGCKMRKARDWSVRCQLEAQLHDRSCFLTLTYNDFNLPLTKDGDPTLVKRDLQLFLKRLRKELSNYDITIRFFACGEYGNRLARPHYHLLIFGCDFTEFDNIIKNHNSLAPITLRSTCFGREYLSPIIASAWPYGYHVIGSLTPQSCSYVARYVTKKQYGTRTTYGTRQPEFVLMSRRPGIAHDWYEQYGKYVRDNDIVHVGKIAVRPPAYFDRLTELTDSEMCAIIKQRRKEVACRKTLDQGRLNDLERLQTLLLSKKERAYEDGKQDLSHS